MFVSERGAPLTAPGFSHMIERAATAADLGIKAHAHMLRHACGYKLANDGHDTRAIQAYLGHRNIQHTSAIPPWRRSGSRSSFEIDEARPTAVSCPPNCNSILRVRASGADQNFKRDTTAGAARGLQFEKFFVLLVRDTCAIGAAPGIEI